MSFFDPVNNVNIFGFTKSVVNTPKLKRDLEDDPVCGPPFEFMVTTTANGGQVRLHFKEPLNQAQIDAMNAVINGFVEQSVFDTMLKSLSAAQIDGWEVYRKIISLINSNGGLQGYLDTDRIPAVQVIMNLRNMLKDGFFEFTLRYYITEVKPMNLWSQSEEDQILGWIEEAALKWAANPQETADFIAVYKSIPKDQYPFGPNGAP